jgi:hypothetical protein
VVYYRLKQEDYNGTISYSKIVSVIKPTSQNTIVVYPNPFNSDITVDISNFANENMTIKIKDLTGRVILTKEVSALDQLNTVSLNDLANLSKGMYLISIETQTQVHKVIKQ